MIRDHSFCGFNETSRSIVLNGMHQRLASTKADRSREAQHVFDKFVDGTENIRTALKSATEKRNFNLDTLTSSTKGQFLSTEQKPHNFSTAHCEFNRAELNVNKITFYSLSVFFHENDGPSCNVHRSKNATFGRWPRPIGFEVGLVRDSVPEDYNFR